MNFFRVTSNALRPEVHRRDERNLGRMESIVEPGTYPRQVAQVSINRNDVQPQSRLHDANRG
jgi:hypothetical protein